MKSSVFDFMEYSICLLCSVLVSLYCTGSALQLFRKRQTNILSPYLHPPSPTHIFFTPTHILPPLLASPPYLATSSHTYLHHPILTVVDLPSLLHNILLFLLRHLVVRMPSSHTLQMLWVCHPNSIDNYQQRHLVSQHRLSSNLGLLSIDNTLVNSKDCLRREQMYLV